MLRSYFIKLSRVLLLTLTIFMVVGVSFSQQAPPVREEFEQLRELQIATKRNLLERQRLLKPADLVSGQQNFDVQHYHLDLNILPSTQQILGTVVMRATAKSNNLSSVKLDLYSNMSVTSVGEDAVDFSHMDDILQIEMGRVYQPGEIFSVQINYQGTPVQGGFGAFGFDSHNGTPIIWSLSEPYFARTWWPCKDTPTDKADSVDVILTVPENLIAVSNGKLIEETANDDGTRTFHWHENYPITTYLVSLAITNYATFSDWFLFSPFDSMEVKYYVYPEYLATAKTQLTETVSMLTYFHEIFGPYPFLTEKYGIAQFPWGGGMEHQTVSSQGSFGSILTVHELAHQWWGDKITNASWQEIWLNEGFASYAEALYYEHTQGKDYYQTYMSWMDRNFPYPIFVDDTTSVSRIFHNTVYDKGAWFLHMLRHIVGDDNFFEILLAYSHDPRFAYGNATTAGFQDVCETVSGMDLDWFFQPWIYEVGRPVYRAEWSVTDSSGAYNLNLKIQQTQYPGQALFPMPIDIIVETLSGDTTVTIFNDAPSQNFSMTTSALPTGIILDKNGWILKKVELITKVDDFAPSPSAFALRQNYPNPFNAETVIEFELPEKHEVTLTIYNVHGQQVRRLIRQTFAAGTHSVTWNGFDDRGQPTASGLYILEMGGDSFIQRKKMLLVR